MNAFTLHLFAVGFEAKDWHEEEEGMASRKKGSEPAGEAPAAVAVASFLDLPIDLIEFSSDNPRRAHNERADAELAADVKAHGVLEPVLVRPHPKEPGHYELRAGERRVRACQAAGLDTVPAMVREMDDSEALRVTVVENLQREELTPMESALALELLHKRGWEDDAIGAEIGKSPGWVARRRALNRLSKGWQKVLLGGKNNVQEWPASHLELIARLPEPSQDAILAQFRREWQWQKGIPTRAKIEHEVGQLLRKLAEARWPLADAELLPEAGACAACVKRSSAQPRLFEDLGTSTKDDRCLDQACWEKKAQAYVVRRVAELQEEHGKDLVLLDAGRGEKSPVKGDLVHDWDITRCKPKEPGAKPCLTVTGPNAGQGGWCISRRAASARSVGVKRGPKSLDERRAILQGKRAKLAIAAARSKLDGDAELRDWEDLGLLAATFGAGYFSGELDQWKAYDRLSKKPEAARQALWERIKTELREQFQCYNLDGAAATLGDVERIYRYLGGDWKAQWAEICGKVPEPRAWAKLNKDGSPETARLSKKLGAMPAKAKSATKAKPERGVCRVCGCTETTPCMTASGPCAWADKSKTLCTACVGKAKRPKPAGRKVRTEADGCAGCQTPCDQATED